ncbi:MAG: outer membrane protein, partial [bacterium]
ALIAGAGAALGQVPNKPLPKDSAAKPATKAKAATTKIKIAKEKTAGGEIVLAPVVQPCDTVVKTEFKTEFIVDPKRDEFIRAAQRALDSAAAVRQRTRLMAEMRRRVAAAEEGLRSAALTKKEAQAAALQRSLGRGFYFGIAGGASAPQRTLRNGYTGGYNVTLPFGFDATDLPLGIRTDVSVDHMNGTRLYNAANETIAASGDLTVWSANADLKLRIPTPGGSTRTHFYALGGVGAHRITGGVYGTTDPLAGTNLSFADAGTKLGWNVGGGAAIAWGPAEIFIESRFVQIKTDLGYHMSGGVGTYSAFTPVLIGIQWF